MDRFGPQWVDHAAKIAARWRERVAAGDVVLVTGDISWAMTAEQAKPDLEFLAGLPGRKVLLKGNHDYWWSTASKARAQLPPTLHAVQGDLLRLGPFAIAGTRLWDQPGVSFHDWIDWQPGPGGAISVEPAGDDAAETERLFARELQRLERAMAALRDAGGDAGRRVAITHYPPCGAELRETAATRLIEAAGAHDAVFGHLHSVRRDRSPPPFGSRGATRYTLASCDWLDFAPVELADL